MSLAVGPQEIVQPGVGFLRRRIGDRRREIASDRQAGIGRADAQRIIKLQRKPAAAGGRWRNDRRRRKRLANIRESMPRRIRRQHHIRHAHAARHIAIRQPMRLIRTHRQERAEVVRLPDKSLVRDRHHLPARRAPRLAGDRVAQNSTADSMNDRTADRYSSARPIVRRQPRAAT